MPDVLKKKKFLPEAVKMVLVLFLTAALTAGLLSAVNSLTKEKIEENLGEEIRRSFVAMFGEGLSFKTLDVCPRSRGDIRDFKQWQNYYCIINSAILEI